jgi:hypothetical protein
MAKITLLPLPPGPAGSTLNYKRKSVCNIGPRSLVKKYSNDTKIVLERQLTNVAHN